jgi:aerotaxis receptor
VLGVSSIVAGTALLFQQRQVMGVVRGIIERLDGIAQGDLTDRIPLDRVDELGRLNDAVVTMQTHLKAMMAEIAEASNRVRDNVGGVSTSMHQAQQVAMTQSEAAARISAAVQQMTASVEEIAESAQQAAAAVGESAAVLDHAAQRMEESRSASRTVVATVGDASSTMAELFQSIFAIGRITQAIREIADQTNLLALNAAIEAARAGESGRGFAVVADEVRKLAEKAGTQTEEIGRSISEIQRITQIAVTGMEQAGTHVGTTEAAMERAQEGLAEVDRQGSAVTEHSRRIAERTREQSAASGEISQQVGDIAQGLEQTSQVLSAVGSQAEALTETADRLRELIHYFRFIR